MESFYPVYDHKAHLSNLFQLCIILIFSLTVDTQPPVIANCPAPISVVIELGSTGGVAFWTEPTATDFSGTVTLIERTNSPGSVFSIGTTVVRYTFSDNGGNEDFCTFPVTVTTGKLLFGVHFT